MNKNRYHYFFLLTVIIIAVINVLTVYMNISSQEYVSYGSVSVRKSMLNTAGEILSSYDNSEYPDAIKKMQEEYDFYVEYINALQVLEDKAMTRYSKQSATRIKAEQLVSKHNITESQARTEMELLDFCIERLEYSVSYGDYISDLNSNIANISGTGIFNDTAKKQAVKAKNDFYGLDEIKISAAPDISINLLFSDRITDILVVAMSVVCSLFFSLKSRMTFNEFSVGKSRALASVCILILGIVAAYSANVYIIESEIGLGDLSRSIQSVAEYRSCPYAISVGTLIIIRAFFKTAACVILYLLCTKILLSRSKIKKTICIILPVVVEILLICLNSRIRYTILFKAESIFGKYNISPVFGEYADTSVIITVLCIVFFLFAVIAVKKEIDNTLLIVKEQAEKRYYDEINTRYSEAQIIHHDMKNHLTAIAILLDNGKVADARMYLKEINSEMDSSKLPMKTGLSVLDALLFKKFDTMRKEGIELNVTLESDLSETGISEYELCSVFGNVLDNAYEACCMLPDDDKTVTMSVRRQLDMLCIFCENRYKEINQDLSTRKKDKKHHGLGLRSIRRIAEKYGGTLDISLEDNVFKVSVLMNLTKGIVKN